MVRSVPLPAFALVFRKIRSVLLANQCANIGWQGTFEHPSVRQTAELRDDGGGSIGEDAEHRAPLPLGALPVVCLALVAGRVLRQLRLLPAHVVQAGRGE